MEIQKTKRRCKACCHYDVFYTKGAVAFYKQKIGFCLCRAISVNEIDGCGLYKHRVSNARVITPEHIDIVVEDIEELERIFYNYD